MFPSTYYLRMLLYDLLYFLLFFFNDPATTEIYTLSLHDALPISGRDEMPSIDQTMKQGESLEEHLLWQLALSPLDKAEDRKSTRLNSSHANISYAVFCLKKKKKKKKKQQKYNTIHGNERNNKE